MTNHDPVFHRTLTDIARAARLLMPEFLNSPSFAASPLKLLPFLARREFARQSAIRRLGTPVPAFCMVSLTWRCNLRCKGCYAANYTRRKDLPLETIERVIRDATSLGTYLFILVGGEPLLVPGLVERLSSIPDALFFLFTNGTLLSDDMAERIARADRIIPVLSVDGPERLTDDRRGAGIYRATVAAMARLRSRRVFLGVSSVVTRQNVAHVTSREWFDRLWEDGARIVSLIDYIPFPHSLEPDLVLQPSDIELKTKAVARRYAEARPFMVNFPAHEYVRGRCGAGGKGFLHINADGFVEPCPFSHYAADNILDKPLLDILRSPFLGKVRACARGWSGDCHGQCSLFVHDADMRRLAAETQAFSTEALSA